MEDYVEETKNVIKDLTYDLITKKGSIHHPFYIQSNKKYYLNNDNTI